MNQKGISSILIILIIVGVLAVAGGTWYFYKIATIRPLTGCDINAGQERLAKNIGTNECKGFSYCDNIPEGWTMVENCEDLVIDTANWKTYRNEEYGFEARYPEEWVIQELKLFPESVVLNPPPFGILKEEFIKLIDAPSFGLITFTIEKGGEAPSIWKDSYSKMRVPEIEMGYNNTIMAKKTEEKTGSNNPNPSYNNRHFIRYKILTKDNAGEYCIDIFYNSDIEDKHLNVFNQILSTFKFID